MTVHALADPDTVRKALDVVGEELLDKRLLGEIMVCSGESFLLRYGWTDDGKRIEVDISLDGRDGPVRQACEDAGRNFRLPESWLERVLPRLFGNVTPNAGGFPSGMYPTWERPGLRVVAAPPQLLIPIFFLATLKVGRHIEIGDMEAAYRIAAKSGVMTGRSLRRQVLPYLDRKTHGDYDMEHLMEGRLAEFEEILERLELGLPLSQGPKSMAQVADLIQGNPDWYMPVMLRFEEAFFAAESNEARQAMLDPVPEPTGDWKNDAWIGAIGEHLAQRWNLMVPSWTQEAAFMAGSTPQFRALEPTARDIEIVETPPAFRRRLLFSSAEPLMSAKFPNAMKVRMPFWKE